MELALHEWGQWNADLGQPVEIADLLTLAWIRRKRLEAKFVAFEIVTLLGQALSSDAPSNNGHDKAGSDALLRSLGLDI